MQDYAVTAKMRANIVSNTKSHTGSHTADCAPIAGHSDLVCANAPYLPPMLVF